MISKFNEGFDPLNPDPVRSGQFETTVSGEIRPGSTQDSHQEYSSQYHERLTKICAQNYVDYINNNFETPGATLMKDDFSFEPFLRAHHSLMKSEQPWILKEEFSAKDPQEIDLTVPRTVKNLLDSKTFSVFPKLKIFSYAQNISYMLEQNPELEDLSIKDFIEGTAQAYGYLLRALRQIGCKSIAEYNQAKRDSATFKLVPPDDFQI
ncbi:MAG: hypothetical protein HZA80_01740 [Candidatus Taylorbacteria bacterium]|nr:hypothetical protein [Candidatus Taylorbacteria bacterium]